MSCVTSLELTCGQFRPLGTLSVDIWSAPAFVRSIRIAHFQFQFPMPHLRLLISQCLIYASNRDLEIQELQNLHLVSYSILVILGPLPALSSILEVFRTSSAACTWSTQKSKPIELPQNLGELSIPGHPCRGAELKPFDALRAHPWSAWLLANCGSAITTLEDIILSAELMFPKPFGPHEQLILRWLRDAQVTLRNVVLFLHLSSQPQSPSVPPAVTTPAPSTPDLWGE